MIDIVNNLLGYLCVVLAIILYPIFCLKELFEKNFNFKKRYELL